MSDVKTLRLASIQLTSELLDRFLSYQRLLLAELEKHPHPEWSGRFAFAHQHGLAGSGLDPVTYGKLKSLMGDYCSHATTVATVRLRMKQAQATVDSAREQGLVPPPREVALLERAGAELAGLEETRTLKERYGDDAVALLEARSEEIVGLHHRVAREEGCPRATH